MEVCNQSVFTRLWMLRSVHGMSSLRKRTSKILLPVFSVLAVIVQNDTVVAAGSEPLDEHLRLCIKDFMKALLEYPLIPMLYESFGQMDEPWYQTVCPSVISHQKQPPQRRTSDNAWRRKQLRNADAWGLGGG